MTCPVLWLLPLVKRTFGLFGDLCQIVVSPINVSQKCHRTTTFLMLVLWCFCARLCSTTLFSSLILVSVFCLCLFFAVFRLLLCAFCFAIASPLVSLPQCTICRPFCGRSFWFSLRCICSTAIFCSAGYRLQSSSYFYNVFQHHTTTLLRPARLHFFAGAAFVLLLARCSCSDLRACNPSASIIYVLCLYFCYCVILQSRDRGRVIVHILLCDLHL